MARREAKEHNEILIQDHLSGSELGLYYRMPTTAERQSYINRQKVRMDGKWVDNSVSNRVAHASSILTGLREGDFERKDGDLYIPISTDTQSEYYHPEWRQWMEDNCSDILTMVAVRVFEMPVTLAVKADKEGLEGE